jgi:carbamate kinase
VRIVIALGGNALLQKGQPANTEIQRENIRAAVRELAPLARSHELVLSHGNGPQVGLLALQAACYQGAEPAPLDVLDAETEGMIGYLIEQELSNLLPPDIPCATILTMVEVDPLDPAFSNPTKFVGPWYPKAEADRIAKEKGWTFRKEQDGWRRVVPSPMPVRIVELRPIRWLLEKKVVVICTGGGGIPTVASPGSHQVMTGVEAVIDKDRAGALLASDLTADLYVMATDVPGVYFDWMTPRARLIRDITPGELRNHRFEEGSMGPKVEAACRFTEKTGKRSAIGSLSDIAGLVEGTAGTQVRKQDTATDRT